jgi:hypothetical protein
MDRRCHLLQSTILNCYREIELMTITENGTISAHRAVDSSDVEGTEGLVYRTTDSVLYEIL